MDLVAYIKTSGRVQVLDQKRSTLSGVGVFGLALLLGGCATARIEQSGQFAQAGQAYTKAISALTDAVGEAAVTHDSVHLAGIRDSLNEGDRVKELDKNDAELEKTLKILALTKAQAKELENYFLALGALAGSDSAQNISQATNKSILAIGKMNKDIGAYATEPVAEIAAGTSAILVKNIQSAALMSEIKMRKEVLDQAFALQKEAVELLAGRLEKDQSAAIAARKTAEVDEVYAGSKPLPDNWIKKRSEMIRLQADLQAVTAAKSAAAKMEVAWNALKTGQFGAAELAAVIKDSTEVMELAEKIRIASTK